MNPADEELAHSIFPDHTKPFNADELKLIVDRHRFQQQHQGHETQHTLMFLIFLGVLLMLPGLVKYWQRRHPTSYRLVSIGSICLIPPYYALYGGYYRFVLIWLIYSTSNTYILYLATRVPLHERTPRRVYQWFAVVNKMSYGVSVMGFFMFMVCFFNLIPGWTDTEWMVETNLLTLFYGLYFGLMSRDLVYLSTDRIAATLGYYAPSKEQLPSNRLPADICCICRVKLGNEPSHKLGCGHEFHALCIRGWCVVGKRDMCPYCREKVDLEEFRQNPWDRQELFYVTALEYMRFFVSWQPLTLFLLAAVFWVLGLN